ncbi:MAG TPA: hypothetical protein VGD42_10185 [Lysobacter sp.]
MTSDVRRRSWGGSYRRQRRRTRMKQRLHAVEGMVELISTDPWIFKPSELYKIDGELRDELRNFNIYLVARRPRMSIDPASLSIRDGKEVSGAFIAQDKGDRISFGFVFRNPFDQAITEVGTSGFPHSSLRFTCGSAPFEMRLHDVVRFSEVESKNRLDMKIEYVGQSFGDEGDSDAIQRLIGKTGKQGHGSLQRILADITDDFPDSEAHVLLYSYGQYKNFMFMGGGSLPVFDFDADEGRLDRLMNAAYSRENRIDLAEAALIKYFQPKYNETYKKNFPDATHKMLESLFSLDVTGLAVTLSTMEHGVRTYSDHASPRELHCARYSIVTDKDRASFLDLANVRDDDDV